MEKINLILSHEKYNDYLTRINKCEVDRNFCRHDVNHFLDVARIAYILNLEKGLNHTKEEIYAAALLHDIGKFKHYEEKIPHEIASAELAYYILLDCNFNKEAITKIISAIRNHREKPDNEDTLDYIIYMADKLSRACFQCASEKECYWTKEKKNLKILY